ncbi:hypothetical protein B2K_01595 [Paenibacillus mucilaginosus K02]|uniref:Uncharacterized protein n=1 Tax=Paenibacillus mucilaginosus K02 TaxID=997761 RepID=I0BAN5_9BACL|nr:hypothetical protein B2K_01595 [Paenibacillus mucilaginosus K02]
MDERVPGARGHKAVGRLNAWVRELFRDTAGDLPQAGMLTGSRGQRAPPVGLLRMQRPDTR